MTDAIRELMENVSMKDVSSMLNEMKDHVTASGSVAKIPDLILKIKAQTLKVQEAKVIHDTEKGILAELEKEGMQALLDSEMKEFSNKEGTIKLHTRRMTKKPAHGSPEWDDLKDYLKEQGIWENMATVNANTLSSWYNRQMEEHADDPSFEIPGLEKKEYTSLKFNRNSR